MKQRWGWISSLIAIAQVIHKSPHESKAKSDQRDGDGYMLATRLPDVPYDSWILVRHNALTINIQPLVVHDNGQMNKDEVLRRLTEVFRRQPLAIATERTYHARLRRYCYFFKGLPLPFS